MADEVLSLFASPRSLFLRTWTFSSQSFKAMVTSVKNFRWATPWGREASNSSNLIVGNDIGWLIFSTIPLFSTVVGIGILIGHPHVYNMLGILDAILMFFGTVIHDVVMFSVIYWHRDMPFRLIGAKSKFMLELIPMIIAATFHHLFEFNYGYFHLVVGFTTYFYTIAHFMHAAYDIGGKDVLLGLVMLVLAYIVKGELLVRAIALSLCVMLCFYRYVMYSAPQVPEHRKKELEWLPC